MLIPTGSADESSDIAKNRSAAWMPRLWNHPSVVMWTVSTECAGTTRGKKARFDNLSIHWIPRAQRRADARREPRNTMMMSITQGIDEVGFDVLTESCIVDVPNCISVFMALRANLRIHGCLAPFLSVRS